MDWSLKSRRNLWLKVHLYLGLFVGTVFVLIGLTGSLLAFEYPLDEWLNAELMSAPSTDEHKSLLPLDDIVRAGVKALPADGKADAIAFP
ncbi:MAG: PepSY domain-containing protein, partial [Methylococcaceae bacterium]|nr:PepSY domain-containing protein [Methylococcaceae bacterium]